MSYDVSGATLTSAPCPISRSRHRRLRGRPDVTFRIRRGIHYAPLLEDVEIASTDFVRAIMRATTNFDPEQPALTGYFDIIDGFVDFAAGDASSIVGPNT